MSVFGDGTEGFRLFWTGDDETDCVEICRDLMSAGVEYRVSQEPVGLSGRMGVTWRFEIVVPRSQFELAKQAAGWAVEKEPGDQGFELNEDSGITIETEHDHRRSALEYLKPWSSEDATIEICSQRSSDKSSIIELSLRENLVHFRVDREKTGTRKYFVLPQDEARAREILRQIEKGEPPQ
jgi:hypothetical protein